MKDMVFLASDIPVEWHTPKNEPGSINIIKMSHNHCSDDRPDAPRFPSHDHYILNIFNSQNEIQINLEDIITCVKLYCPELLVRKKY